MPTHSTYSSSVNNLTNILVKQHKLLLTSGKDINL